MGVEGLYFVVVQHLTAGSVVNHQGMHGGCYGRWLSGKFGCRGGVACRRRVLCTHWLRQRATLKAGSGTNGACMLQHQLAVGASLLASSLRGWRGTNARPAVKQPKALLELYEFEACPFCRLVRETLTELDLDAMIYPCPSGGERFRPKAVALGGKALFPLLHDVNTGTVMYESADIIEYLWQTYAGRAAPSRMRPLAVASSVLASASRPARGQRAQGAHAPKLPLELYSFESSPFSRLVRERLSELELPYILRSFGKAHKADMGPPWVRSKWYPQAPVIGRNRSTMHQQLGRMQVPYLVDANTDTALFESATIIAYLNRRYAE